ncbi:MAG TPA: TetR/AcrR family transcriptional regulator [Mycobacterium sp.]|nr:TetR/AcrR family transcriptional regulator [Mycobacterium sp.]
MADRKLAGAAVLREDVTDAISRAAFEELAETGYARMTMEAVTRRAGVGKAALYRRWPAKDAMVIDLVARAVSTYTVHEAHAIDTGSLRGDVEAFLADTVAVLRHPLVSRIVPDLFAEALRNPALGDALRTAGRARRSTATGLLRRAIDRAELPEDLDVDLALDLLGAPVEFRVLFTDMTTDDAYLSRLATAVLAALGECRSRQPGTPTVG